MTEKPKRSLGAPLEVVRQQLMEDEDTIAIAKSFELPLEKYVEMVLEYALDPEKEPEIILLDEEVQQTHGENLPSPHEVMNWLEQVASGEIELGPPQMSMKDKVEKGNDREPLSKFTGSNARPMMSNPAPQAPKSQTSSVLKQELMNRRSQENIQKFTKQKDVSPDKD